MFAAMPILRALDPDGPGSITLEHFVQLAAACSTPQLGDDQGGRGSTGDGAGYGGDDGAEDAAYDDAGAGEGGDPPRADEEGDPKVLEFIR